MAALAAVVLALANALPVAHYLAGPSEPAVAGSRFRAVLLNVWLRNDEYGRVLDYVSALEPDVAVFLEVTPEWREALRRLPGLPHQSLADEVLVASRQPLAGLGVLPLGGGSATAVRFTYEADGVPVTVIGTHANWPLGAAIAASRNRELSDLGAEARATRGPLLLLGDLNTTAFSPGFAALLATSGMRDCAAGRGLNPTWPAQFPLLYLQIDHCLAGPGLRIERLRTGPRVGSDHLPLEVEVVVARAAAGIVSVSAAAEPRTSLR